MEILNLKKIPLKIFFERKNKKIVIAWHWPRSITWRWLIDWRFCKAAELSVKRFKNPNTKYSLTTLAIKRLGIITVTTQDNMKRV